MSEACGKEIASKQVTDVVKENGIEVSGMCNLTCSFFLKIASVDHFIVCSISFLGFVCYFAP